MQAFDPDKLFERAKTDIVKHQLIFIEDICAHGGYNKSSFYKHFPTGSDRYLELFSMLEENKISMKVAIRKKWLVSDNPTAQMALYKLCSTRDEHMKLQQNYVEHKDTSDVHVIKI